MHQLHIVSTFGEPASVFGGVDFSLGGLGTFTYCMSKCDLLQLSKIRAHCSSDMKFCTACTSETAGTVSVSAAAEAVETSGPSAGQKRIRRSCSMSGRSCSVQRAVHPATHSGKVMCQC